MRIGLYGMPTAGKSFILNQLDFIEVVHGSRSLHTMYPDFDLLDLNARQNARNAFAKRMKEKETFIMDGHYAFGNEIAFSENDGKLFDVFLYLYISPAVLKSRMSKSVKNQKYLRYDIDHWQKQEILCLRDYCHRNGKDFYVLDNPPFNEFGEITAVKDFVKAIIEGYSCAAFAKSCASEILRESSDSDTVILTDGDKTLTIEDSSREIFGYSTHLYDGNFYTGFQSWKQGEEFSHYAMPELSSMPVHINEKVRSKLNGTVFILTSGHEEVWRFISTELGIPCFAGTEMSAETKLYITQYLQAAGKRVIAFGDGMNDYFMLKQANQGYLVKRENGSISRSLQGRDLEGLVVV